MSFEDFPVSLRASQTVTHSIKLHVLPPEDADWLGEQFAAMKPWADYPYPAHALAKYFRGNEPHAPRLSICKGQEIIGVLGLHLNWLRGPYIQFLGLLETQQGHGIGRQILNWVEEEARNEASRNIWVLVSEGNLRALAFYERCGFSAVTPLPSLVQDGRTEILLRKQLEA